MRPYRPAWTREGILEKIRLWAAIYGDPPSAQDWNPTMAARNGRHDQAERFYAGSWPFYGSVASRFGSWNEAIRAAGCKPRAPGRRRAAEGLDGEEMARAAAMYSEGWGANEIGDRLGLSSARVLYALRRAGVPIRTHSRAVALANLRKRKTPA